MTDAETAQGYRDLAPEDPADGLGHYLAREWGYRLAERKGYKEFLASKRRQLGPSGMSTTPTDLHPALFDFQRDLVAWALRRGRAALFAGTGLGKTVMQLEWARHTARRTLVIAPLAVSGQTVREGARFGVAVTYCRSQADAPPFGISVTNYEMADRFEASSFGAVVLDESSILKNYAGKMRSALIRQFADVPYRLACTATPAPNDIAEIANHAEFLGVMSRTEMLARFFVHDDEGWRLKGYARGPFFRWLASWAMSVRMPSDLGYQDGPFILPKLEVVPHFLPSIVRPNGQLFATGLHGVQERLAVRRATIRERVEYVAALVNGSPESWIVWCGLNAEGRALNKLVPDSVVIEGADLSDDKARNLLAFATGEIRVLVTKPRIAGFGMNFQNCRNVAFLGLGDSWEQYYQAIRRCWRFGQTSPVRVAVVLTDIEDVIWGNVQAKEAEAEKMQRDLIAEIAGYESEALGGGADGEFIYERRTETGEGWAMHLGDSAEVLKEIGADSIGLSVFSPPFATLYTYSNSERDLGNSSDDAEFWRHCAYISHELLRVLMPGRHACVHVANIGTTLARHSVIGLRDFRGDMIRHMVAQGFIYHGEVCIDKDPQAQAIRTHSKALLFVQKEKDSSWLRPALADYILLFRKPGENPVQVKPGITNDEWIEWARPVWYGIRESNTLNVAEARSDRDERHIAPLQLPVIERCIRLWSNAGETVLSPFAGIGSEGYVAVQRGRRFIGIELKPEYWKVACENLRKATGQPPLF